MNAILTSVDIIHQQPPQVDYRVEELLPEVERAMGKLARLGRNDLTAKMAISQLSSKGKRVRARLALHACAAFGVAPTSAIAWACAVEVLHNATLVHDDVQDGDTVRRGRPTIWAEYGQAQAINAGDYLLMLPFLAINGTDPVHQGVLCSLTAEYCTQIVRGQVDEIDLNLHQRSVSSEFLQACEGKTGALLALPVVGAAILGGMSLSDAQRFSVPFVQLGVLFQLQDDVVDLFGEKGRGRLGSDIYEGKVSALLVALLEREPSMASDVKAILRKPRELTTTADVEFVRRLYEETGALQDVLMRIRQMRQQVLGSTLLRAEPRLLTTATKLCEMALGPIAHLISGDD